MSDQNPAAPAVHDHDSGEGMLSVEDARERVLSRIGPLAPIDLPLGEVFGCVLASDINAEMDLPPFASSAMDGYAVRSADIAGATPTSPVTLPLVGAALIGHRPDAVVGEGETVRIATGAPIPAGADAVIAQESTISLGDSVQMLDAVPMGKHVRPAGEDVHIGDVVAPAGRKLGAPELGLLASAGFQRVPVYPRPRVAVISTGDELVDPGKPLEYGHIYDSNAYTLAAQIKEAGAQPFIVGIVKDDVAALREEVLSQMASADAFVSSGGVSVGERDVVRAAFTREGDVDFYRVAMQPGMPQGFGMIDGKPFFGLPGNPVSVFVSFEVFIRPALVRMMGRTQIYRPQIQATLTEEISGPAGKTQFARVLVKRTPTGWSAAPTGGRGSNLLATVARANGLAIVSPGVATLPAGAQCPVMIFRSMED